MPKPSLKNPFARRRSSGNVLDTESPTPEAPAGQSSFRVIERPEKSKINFDTHRSSQVARPFSSPLQQLRGKSVDDLAYHTNGSVDTAASRKAASESKPGRGSGGTIASASSEFYQSSAASGRFSSSSTLPSSIEQEHESDELFAQKRPLPAATRSSPATARLDEPLPPPPSFSARATRAFSFGLRNKQTSLDRTESASSAATVSPINTTPKLPQPSHSPTRERALTTSSYASTAVPTKLDIQHDLGSSDFGADFGTMFDMDTKSSALGTQRTDSEPIFPARTYKSQSSTASPAQPESPWDRRDSRDGLLASAATSPNLTLGHSSTFFAEPVRGYANVPTPSPDRERALDASPDRERALEASLNRERALEASPNRERAFKDRSTILSNGKRYELRDAQGSPTSLDAEPAPLSANPWEKASSDSTIKASKRMSEIPDDEPLFDAASPNGPASRAKRPQPEQKPTAPRRLTKAQFEILQQYTDTDGDNDSGNEEEDDDEIERAKQVTKQRRKQEANMAVYRQQMKKVTGGGPTDLPHRPGLDSRSASASSLYVGGVMGTPPPEAFHPKLSDDDDDDVPLGILQAHGFPSSSRPPTRLADGRPPSVAPHASQNLPPFARRLPQDPYFGAGLVNPSAREPLAFGGAGSVYGGNSAPPTPGGLVGIIASEEQQRRARRGSPNPATGTYNAMPLPTNMPRSSSMASMQSPMMPGMPMMPQMPMTSDPQMQEFLQVQMQIMQNMQAMLMQSQMQQQQPQQYPADMSRPMSMAQNMLGVSGVAHDQGRTMSMLGPPAAWNASTTSRPVSAADPRMSTYAASVNGFAGHAAGYQPSIAPSERSNVGMPGRYRPVQNDDGRTTSLTSSMTLNAFAANQQTLSGERPTSQVGGQRNSTIRVVDKPKSLPKLNRRQPEPDDDEDGSWADMVKKKLTSKRGTRASKAAGERVALGELYTNVE